MATPLVRTRWSRGPLLLTLPCLLLASLACTLTGAPARSPYPPGGELTLSVEILHQFSHLERPDVQIWIRFPTMAEPLPADDARVTCNGRDVTPRMTPGMYQRLAGPLPCPRQPPGGACHLVYTDEHGARTAAVIPVPLGALVFRVPAQGTTLPIPRGHALTLRLVVPVPPRAATSR